VLNDANLELLHPLPRVQGRLIEDEKIRQIGAPAQVQTPADAKSSRAVDSSK
jgi:hypothetical protein